MSMFLARPNGSCIMLYPGKYTVEYHRPPPDHIMVIGECDAGHSCDSFEFACATHVIPSSLLVHCFVQVTTCHCRARRPAWILSTRQANHSVLPLLFTARTFNAYPGRRSATRGMSSCMCCLVLLVGFEPGRPHRHLGHRGPAAPDHCIAGPLACFVRIDAIYSLFAGRYCNFARHRRGQFRSRAWQAGWRSMPNCSCKQNQHVARYMRR